MRHHRVFCVLVLGIILPLLLVSFLTVPAQAAVEIELILSPDEGKLGDKIDIEGRGFDEGSYVYLYFSSDKANAGDYIDDEITHYELLERNIRTSDETSLFPGEFDTYFKVPEELNDGEDVEDVHDGEYYVYATYRISKEVMAVASFTVFGSEIEVEPEEATVGAEVRISGVGLRPDQEITIEYDGHAVDIISGDTRTDSDGQFTGTIIVPEGPAGNYIITAIDESGNRPEAEFGVKPKITLAPSLQDIDKAVAVSGTGFGARERVTITIDGNKVPTTPISLHTNRLGSLGGSFVIPSHPAYTDGGIARVQVRDESDNVAEAELTVLTILASISLYPATNRTSPGHVGMELTIGGIWFVADATVTITYSNGEVFNVATTEVGADRTISATFTVPPSIPGSHVVTASDGANSVTTIFTMESETPLTPVPLLPIVAATAEAETYFDWKDVTDPSGITYVLQIGTDSDFATIVLEKRGLTDSEYTLTAEEKLAPTEKETPYYWRVKAIDGTLNESNWIMPSPFYIGSSRVALPNWTKYIWIGIGGALAVILILRARRGRTE